MVAIKKFKNKNDYLNYGESKLVDINDLDVNEEILSPIMEGKNYVGESFFVRDYELNVSDEDFLGDYY